MASSFQEAGQSLFNSWNINLDEISFEQLDHYIAVKNYLMDEDELSPNTKNIEKVKGLLEAFYHLCDVEDWVKAEYIFKIRLEITQKQELHNQLFTWGYYNQHINLYNSLLDKTRPRIDIICYKGLAQTHNICGRYEQAIECCNKGLIISKNVKDVDGQSHFYNIKGNIYCSLERYQDAIQIFNKALQNPNNLKLESTIYKNLGNAYFGLNKVQEAIHGYQISLNIAEEIKDNKHIAGAYIEIANVYGFLEKFECAEKYIRKAQPFVEASEDYLDITNYKEKLGLILCCQYKYTEGLKLLEEALERFDKMGYLERIMGLSWNLSSAYYEDRQLKLERKYCEQALKISTELDIPLAKKLAKKCQELLSKIEEEAMNAQEN